MASKNEALADRITDAIFTQGDGPEPCYRVQFMIGRYGDERSYGGLCKDAFRQHVLATLEQSDG